MRPILRLHFALALLATIATSSAADISPDLHKSQQQFRQIRQQIIDLQRQIVAPAPSTGWHHYDVYVILPSKRYEIPFSPNAAFPLDAIADYAPSPRVKANLIGVMVACPGGHDDQSKLPTPKGLRQDESLSEAITVAGHPATIDFATEPPTYSLIEFDQSQPGQLVRITWHFTVNAGRIVDPKLDRQSLDPAKPLPRIAESTGRLADPSTDGTALTSETDQLREQVLDLQIYLPEAMPIGTKRKYVVHATTKDGREMVGMVDSISPRDAIAACRLPPSYILNRDARPATAAEVATIAHPPTPPPMPAAPKPLKIGMTLAEAEKISGFPSILRTQYDDGSKVYEINVYDNSQPNASIRHMYWVNVAADGTIMHFVDYVHSITIDQGQFPLPAGELRHFGD